MQARNALIAFAREALGLLPQTDVELIPLAGRGSDRSYFRLRWNSGQSAILVHYAQSRVENACFADIAQFLQEIAIPVPSVLRHDRNGGLIAMTDLGDVDLWSLRHEPWHIRKSLYQKTLAAVKRLHAYPLHSFPSTKVTLMEAFGPDLYRWERHYFRDNFVAALCGISLDPDFERRLETELAGLAERLAGGSQSLVHRDLQSQNVMVYRDEPFLIDFQGMRFGNPFYDLGSLLCDPYVAMTSEERHELLSFYFGLSPAELSWDRFQKAFWEASAQRLMQALGAYGFLGLTKGLEQYLAHVPSGLANLRAAAENAASLPHLVELCTRCERESRIRDSGIEG